MKVLFLTSSYPTPEAPVAGIFVQEHARAAALHAEVAVIHLDRGGSKRLRITNVPDAEFPTVRVSYPRVPLALSGCAHLVGAARGFRQLRRRGFDPGVIHAHFFLAGFPAVLLGRRHRKAVVVTEHWSVFLREDPMSLGPFLRWAARFTFTKADAVLPVSEALRRGIAESLGIDPRARVVPNAVDSDLFFPAAVRVEADELHLLSVGLHYPAKGVDMLLEAVAQLRKERGEFRLLIAGDGPQRVELEELAQELGVAQLVSFLGLRTKPQVAELMRHADLFVLPSRFETGAVAASEALMSGLPVVGTRVGAVPELVDEGSGVLATPDARALANAIATAIDQRDEFDRPLIARRARERYGRDAIGRLLEEVYTSCLARDRRSQGPGDDRGRPPGLA